MSARRFCDYRGKLNTAHGEAVGAGACTGWVIHDLRRTARSPMLRAGVDADIAERCLGHVIGGVWGRLRPPFFLEEKRIAFEKLAALIERIVNPQRNVVPMTKRGPS
jgi:integrase